MAKHATQLSNNQPPVSTEFHPTHGDIAALAYALWQEKNCPEGTGEADWLRAEQELIANRVSAVEASRG